MAETRECPECGEQAGRVPEDLRGRYEVPDGAEFEVLYVHSGDFFHRECAERQIEDITTYGQVQPRLVTDGGREEYQTGHPVGRRVRKLDEAIEWAAYREFAIVHGDWDGPEDDSQTG